MDNIKKNLSIEYINKYKNVLYWPMKITGFARFDIKDNNIVKLTVNTLWYRTLLIIVADLNVYYLIYTSVISKNYLQVPDGMCLVHFASFANMMLINLTFVNRESGLQIIEQSFKIDLLLGHKETQFMRNVGYYTFLFLNAVIMFSNLSVGIFLYKVYDVSMTIHIIGSVYFFWLFFSYDDYAFYLMYATFLGLRARYVNVALAKIGDVNEQYLSSRALLNVLFWKKKYNALVTFETKASFEDYRVAFEMIFELLRLLESSYRFPIGLGVWTVVMGTFVSTQTFIERIKNPNALEQERTYIVISWALLTWSFLLLLTLFVDLFEQQLEQTKLICACIQLKPNKSVELYKLTKTLLRQLERHETRMSIYNLFFINSGFVLRMAASTLVYITVQLQLAFPNLHMSYKSNVTANADAE